MLLSVLLSYNSDFDISNYSKDGELLMLQRRECTRKYDSSPLRLSLGDSSYFLGTYTRCQIIYLYASQFRYNYTR